MIASPRLPQAFRRRLVRFAAVLLATVFAVLACWHDTAYAHDKVLVTLHSDGRGSIWADVSWEDGHPVTEGVSAAVSARNAAGKRVGPVAMVPLPRDGTVRYDGTLPVGKWNVTVEAGYPGTGVCSAEFTVGSGAEPRTVACGKPTRPSAPAPPVAAPTIEETSSGGTLLYAGIAIAVVAVAAIAVLLVRGRPG